MIELFDWVVVFIVFALGLIIMYITDPPAITEIYYPKVDDDPAKVVYQSSTTKQCYKYLPKKNNAEQC